MAKLQRASRKRISSGYYRSISEQAAALMQSLAMSHPFVDGNKRVAFALTAVFLKLNGLKLTVEAKESVLFVEIALITERAPLKTIADWIEAHVT